MIRSLREIASGPASRTRLEGNRGSETAAGKFSTDDCATTGCSIMRRPSFGEAKAFSARINSVRSISVGSAGSSDPERRDLR